MLSIRSMRSSVRRVLGTTALACAAFYASAEEPLIVELNHHKTGLAFEAYALTRAGKSFDEDYALGRFTDYRRLDEFDKRSKRADYLADIREGFEEAAASIKDVDYFVFDGTVTLGDFDFETKSFPMLRLYESARGGSYYIEVEREPGMDEEWYYDSKPFGADTISNYWPTVELPSRGVFSRWREGQYQFDWSPVLTNYAFREASEGKEFLDTFGRRPHARLVARFEGVEETEEYRRFNFSVSCMMFLARKNQQIHAQMIAPPNGSGEPCDAYFQQILREGWGFMGTTPIE